MKKILFICAFICIHQLSFCQSANEWISLFDGKTFTGWRPNENPSSFKIEDGAIVVNGPTAHLFYDGEEAKHQFKNFDLKVKLMTTPGSNSGIYIHTQFQENGWPEKGYEIQVNNSHTDWRRTASVYGLQDVKEIFVKDNEWFTEEIIVRGKKISVKINDKIVNEYTVPETGGRLNGGTFALQAHDPKSKVFYKEVIVKLFPD
ncbi:MAG TPA: DUF1080 domain-containing protein [Cytophagales bacterium]|jgi:hypothetical protein|nr:DUF1080 domain-containing protein [Cytophagales bacterium]